MKKSTFTCCLILFFLFQLHAQEFQRRSYTTARVIKDPPKIDGILEPNEWLGVEWGENFTVHEPNNGDAPKQQSKFKILYDDNNIYVCYYALHDDPSKIESRLSRRDNFPGDWMEINIDSYYDKNTAFSFTLSASGVKGDEFVTNNGNNWDSNWNPIWYSATKINSDGWTAEVKIPLSQLRFADKEEHVWGFNVMRRDFGGDERSTFQFVPRNVTGWVSNYAELHGIQNIKPKRQIEIQPYAVSSLTSKPKEEGNPYADGAEFKANFGLDGKIGVTNDLTLDFTINPDFGQVEADPSALNLDGFQIFFNEQRPFFVENANIFEFQVAQLEAGGPFRNDNLFYSRRVGASPRGQIDNIPKEAFTSSPGFTNILAAAKLSGKTQDGWSIGILESVTAKEYLEITYEGQESRELIEPMTNYFVGRVSKDYKEGASQVGISLTNVTRFLDDSGLEDQFHNQAYSGGVNLFHSWKEREWQINGNFIFSHVAGTKEKITSTQESFEHYFQRPDANYLSVDNNKTSLTGHGGTISFGNYGGKDNISFQSGVTWRSPELDLNDIGFLNTADQIDFVNWAGYRSPKPFSIFRQLGINFNSYHRWNFDGKNIYNGINTNFFTALKNYWTFGGGTTYEFRDISTKALFGGPKLRQSSGMYNFINIGTDNRKKARFYASAGMFNGLGVDKGSVTVRNMNIGGNYQPINALRFSVDVSYFQQLRVIQNVSDDIFEGEDRYITGTIAQKTFSTSFRANYSLTPNLSLQYWGQPFISKGNYSDFKYITDPLNRDFEKRYQLYTSDQISYLAADDVFVIDEDRDGGEDYRFEHPDFNFLQFRSNLVIRWEYKPNSEFFLVWTQSQTNFADPQNNIFPSLRDDLFGSRPDNIFLMKLTYRFY
ncbi:MAG: DUF5916 domain-containing protein [Bacteroidota bacterium]